LIDFSKKLNVLAPLAGYTDLPFRRVVKKFGADLTVSEMISSNALAYNSKKTLKMLEKSPLETPYSVQLAGNSAEFMKKAVEVLNNIDGIDCIDLNSGCPAPKVSHHGSGSALLKELDKLREFIDIIKETSNKKYTSVKVRIGYDTKIPEEIAKAIEGSGADFVAVHGRTKSGGYKSVVDYDAIKSIKEIVSIPVIANGDITSYQKAQDVLAHTNADGVMIGRGAIGNPWIFYQLSQNSEKITDSIKKAIILEHYDGMIEFYGPQRGIPMFRKHIHTYSKGIDGASSFRQLMNRLENPDQVRVEIENFFIG
jgi:tRNA-dihydrouridine synthase B